MLQYAKKGTQDECYRQIDQTSTKSERTHAHTRKTIEDNQPPLIVLVIALTDVFKPNHGLLNTYHVMDDLFVYLMGVTKFSQIYKLSCADEFDLGCVSCGILEMDNHTIGHVQKLTVDFEDP